MAELKQIMKELSSHQNIVGSMFQKPPDNDFSRVSIFGEISSLSDFTEESLYMFYEFYLPIGWKIDNENEDYLIYQSENLQEENLNKLKSISQTSTGYVNPNFYSFKNDPNFSFYQGNMKGDIHTHEFKDRNAIIHNFSLPFELELLGHNSILNKIAPKLLIQINSCDSWGRHRIEGYAYVPIPIQNGSINVDVNCYKPVEDNYLKVYSFFLGGSRKIPDLKELAKSASETENTETLLNKYGIKTEYAGTANINFNVLVQDKRIMEEARKEIKSRQGLENYNLLLGIKSALGEKVGDINLINNQNQMQTTQHGLINRYGV